MPGPSRKRSLSNVRPDIDFTLRKIFGKETFRPVQREVIESVLAGHDVYLQAATSFGKSLCFQLPAVVDYGITIVISPLLALMSNQMAGLRAANIRVETLNGSTSQTIKDLIMEDLKSGHPLTRLLYVTPEYCLGQRFRDTLRIVHGQKELARIAIDEAHCISEWGHDFRKAFKDLKFFKEEFPTVPMICCTATATSRVRQDIIDTLKLNPRTLKSFTMTTARPNLHYEVRYTSYSEDRYSDDLLPWLRAIHARRRDNPTRAAELSHAGERPTNISGIIYTLTRAETETLAARLTADGIGAKPYHAGLTLQARAAHLAGWVADSPGFDVMVATTAFGMGIDKGNVRFVVHWSLPKSFEGFYQEAGRAGRDGKASVCRLYYAREDRDRGVAMFTREMQKGLHARGGGAGGGGAAAAAAGGEKMRQSVEMRGKSLQALIAYCENVGACRHALIAKYFGEGEGDASLAPPSVKCEWACDWHKDPEMLKRRKELGLADEEWCATQRETGAYGEYDEYD